MKIDCNTTRDKVWDVWDNVRGRALDKVFDHELNSLRPDVWRQLFVPVSSYSNALRSLTREQVRYEMYAVKSQ